MKQSLALLAVAAVIAAAPAAAQQTTLNVVTAGDQNMVDYIKDFLAPALLDEPIANLASLARKFSPFRGHNMAKAGLELAFMDLLAQVKKQSLATLIGGKRKRVAVGVSLGIQPTVSQLLKRVEHYLNLGYQRIKLKIKPGKPFLFGVKKRRGTRNNED